MFVPSSKGGILVRKLREREEILAELTGFRIKYQEAGGTQLKSMFSTYLGRGAHCGRGNCHPCSMEGESRQNCRVKNIVYESTCLICNEPKKATSLQEGLHEEQGNKEVSRQLAVCSNSRQNQESRLGIYIGESSRSLFERSKEHIKDAINFKADSHIIKHWILTHPVSDTMPPMSIRIQETYSDCLSRQLGEALKIHFSNDTLLNGRNEYLSNCVTRLTTSESLAERRDRDRREEEEEIKWKIRVDEFRKQKMKIAKDHPPPQQPTSHKDEPQGNENSEPEVFPEESFRKRKKRRLNSTEVEVKGKDPGHTWKDPVLSSSRKASNRMVEFNLAWFKLWWKRMEREGEQEEKDRRLEQMSSSNLMSKFLVKGKKEMGKEEKESNEQNLKRSAAENTKNLNFGVGLKWDSSKQARKFRGSDDSPANRRKRYKPGARTPSASSDAKSE